MGDMSPRPMNDISILLDEIYYPILNNPANQEGWPDVIKKDVDLHIQDLRNAIAEVRIFKRSNEKSRLCSLNYRFIAI